MFNFFATRMSESQSDFFSMLEHAIVPVRATEFAEVETGLKGGTTPTGNRLKRPQIVLKLRTRRNDNLTLR